MTPNDIEHQMVKGIPYVHYHCPQLPNFTLFLWPAFFESRAIFRQMHKVTSNRTRTLKRPKAPNIHVRSTPESQISLHLALRSVIFELQAIVRHAQWSIHKWQWILKRQRCPMYLTKLQLPPSPKFHCIFLQPSIFDLQAIFRQVHWMIPKWTWTLKGEKYQIHVLYGSPSPNFPSFSLYALQSFFFNVKIKISKSQIPGR